MTGLYKAEEDHGIFDKIEKKMEEIDPTFCDQRVSENEMIDNASTAEQLVDLLRKIHGMETLHRLCRLIIERQEETAPIVIEKFLRSGFDEYIESSAIVLGNSDIRYIGDLWKKYKDIRSPYAKSVACIIIGEQFIKDSEEFLFNEFLSLKEKYPYESFYESPLYMLYVINEM